MAEEKKTPEEEVVFGDRVPDDDCIRRRYVDHKEKLEERLGDSEILKSYLDVPEEEDSSSPVDEEKLARVNDAAMMGEYEKLPELAEELAEDMEERKEAAEAESEEAPAPAEKPAPAVMLEETPSPPVEVSNGKGGGLSMKFKPYPGYEFSLYSYLRGDSEEIQAAKQAQGKALMEYEVPEGYTMEDKVIANADGGDMTIRIHKPAGLPEKAPIVLDFHGGAWVAGSADLDNARCIAIATRIPAIVISVNYRLSGKEFHFPAPMLDCRAAYMWAIEHADEIGGDSTKIGLHGSSAGGNLAEGLALYLRDHNEQMPALTVLNCACYSTGFNETHSFNQLYELRMGPDEKALGAEAAFLGGYDGTQPSYYAYPALAHDVGGLGPHFVIMGEYDTLRDDGWNYATRLLHAGVPTEVLVAPRVGHCFTLVPHPYSDTVHDMIALSFRREFGMEA